MRIGHENVYRTVFHDKAAPHRVEFTCHLRTTPLGSPALNVGYPSFHPAILSPATHLQEELAFAPPYPSYKRYTRRLELEATLPTPGWPVQDLFGAVLICLLK